MQRDSGLVRRGKKGLFTLIHHTPDRYKSVETRREVFTALRTSDEEEERAKSFKIKAEQIAIWEARIAGRSNDEQSHAERLAEIAQGRGYKYTPADTFAAGSIESVLRRIAALPEVGHQETVDALLGSKRQAPAATFKLSELFRPNRVHKNGQKSRPNPKMGKPAQESH